MEDAINELEHLVVWGIHDRALRTRFELVLTKLKGAALEQQQSKEKPKRPNPRTGR